MTQEELKEKLEVLQEQYNDLDDQIGDLERQIFFLQDNKYMTEEKISALKQELDEFDTNSFCEHKDQQTLCF